MVSMLPARALLRLAIFTVVVGLVDAVRAEEQALTIDFGRDIRPILSDACFQCHGPDESKREADLRLDIKDGAFAKLDSDAAGAAIVAGQPEQSELYRRITTTDDDERMPPVDSGRTLSQDEIRLIRRWIEEGAAWERHWSFTKIQRPDVPGVRMTDWTRNAIDHFILARLESEGLQPAAKAKRETLIRRVTFDLTGLPPAVAEIDEFVADRRPLAYERLVDRLLNSPSYGERMALEWLDAARYADTHGYHVDSSREMWLWRDWVIKAFNNNMPFDQFATEQLAGDLLPDATMQQRIATGFNRNHGINFEGGAFAEEYRVEYVVDRVHTTSTVFLGLTMKCARCHDHKFDPISQEEYYQFFALFNSVPEKGIDGAAGNAAPVVELASDEQLALKKSYKDQMDEWHKKLKEHEHAAAAAFAKWTEEQRAELIGQKAERAKSPVDDILSLAPRDRNKKQERKLRAHYFDKVDLKARDFKAKREEFRKSRNELAKKMPTSMVMRDMQKPRETFVLTRGLYDQPNKKVSPGLPQALPPLPEGTAANRLGLARWLVDPSQPLTARVTVNRFWQMYFGSGLVKTSENFGSQGEPPSHPELLDWLASEFVRRGWDVRALQRLIVTSATYRQASHASPALWQRDPENRLLARGPRFRLPAEFIRNNALAVSGLLVNKIGGNSVLPYQPEGLWDEVAFGIKTYGAQIYHQDHGDALYRRAMYTFWKRSCPPPSLVTFDAPDREVCMVRRERTNTPLQALVLLNDPTYLEAGRAFAARIMKEGGADKVGRIEFAFRQATARRPTAKEVEILSRAYDRRFADFEQDETAAVKLLEIGELPRDQNLNPNELAAWTEVARIILNLDETINKS